MTHCFLISSVVYIPMYIQMFVHTKNVLSFFNRCREHVPEYLYFILDVNSGTMLVRYVSCCISKEKLINGPGRTCCTWAGEEEEDASGKEKEQVQVQGVPFSQAWGDAAAGGPPPAFSGTEERAVRTLRLQKATTGGSHYCYNSSTSSSGSEPSSSSCSKLAAGGFGLGAPVSN